MHLSREQEYIKLNNFLLKLENEINSIKLDLDDNPTFYFELINFIEEEIKKNKQSIEELKEPFLLFIIGSGNYGKSTIINTLLKDEIVETTDLPNTWKLDLFIKSKKEKIEITYNDNTKITKSLREGINEIKNEEEKFKVSKKKVSKLLKEYKQIKHKDTQELKNIKLKLENQYLYKSNILQIKYFINKSNILDNFIVVDTPGLNQALLKNTFDRAIEYYKKSDGIIWILDAQNLVSKESNDLIDEIQKLENMYSSKKNIIGVINKMDIIRNNSILNIDKVKKRAKEIYKDKVDDIVFISAKEAMEGITKCDDELINKSNIEDLYKVIDKNFKNLSEKNQINSKYQNINMMKNDILNQLHKYKRLLYNDISKYNESIFELKDKINAFNVFVESYLKNIKSKDYITEHEIINLLKDIEKFQNVCNINLNNLYDYLYDKSNFYKNKKVKELDLTLFFMKSKYIFLEPKRENLNKNNSILDNIFLKINNSISEEDRNNSLIKLKINNKLEKLVDEINEKINEKIMLIESTINKLRYESFRNKHIEYIKVKTHLEHLNSIEDIIKNLG